MKLKKRKKSNRMRGSRTHGWAMKKHKGSGNRGGKGFAGTGKRADQKKTYVLKYHFPYFGKQGYTSRSTKKRKLNIINVGDIEKCIMTFLKEGRGKKTQDGLELDLHDYRILGDGELKEKLIVTALAASQSAVNKIEQSGGRIILQKRNTVKNTA